MLVGMGGGAHARARSRHPLAGFLVAGVVGGGLAWLVAGLLLSDAAAPVTDRLEPGPSIAVMAFVASGVLLGWLVAALSLASTRGAVRCPRCGTPNPPTSTTCRACGL